jgi:hypothetical protein
VGRAPVLCIFPPWSTNTTRPSTNSKYVLPLPNSTDTAVKRKHLRQNKDLVKYALKTTLPLSNSSKNQAQALRIKTLETDIRRLLDENLALKAEVVHTKCQLARHSSKAGLVDSATAAHRALEKVILELAGVKAGLQDGIAKAADEEVDLACISPKKMTVVKERRRMDLKFDEFNEERKNKQKALASGYHHTLSGLILIL